jgi:hypothetical protein
MARSFDSDKAAAWRRRFGRFKRSRLTVTQFCRQEGVSTASFYWWRKRLADPQAPRPNGKARRRTSKRDAGRVPAFQTVRVTPAGAPLSVHLPGGMRVEVPADNLDVVRAVVGELAKRSAALDQGETSC